MVAPRPAKRLKSAPAPDGTGCSLCGKGIDTASVASLGPMLGPFCPKKSKGKSELYCHTLCAVWSSEVGILDSAVYGLQPAETPSCLPLPPSASAASSASAAIAPGSLPGGASSTPGRDPSFFRPSDAGDDWLRAVSEVGPDSLSHVEEAVARGRRIRCTWCKESGATIGCFSAKCNRSYHYSCAVQSGCHLMVAMNALWQGTCRSLRVCFCAKHGFGSAPAPPPPPQEGAEVPLPQATPVVIEAGVGAWSSASQAQLVKHVYIIEVGAALVFGARQA
jgi:hypothetical protein